MRKIERLELFKAQTGLNDHQITVDCGLSFGLLANTRKSANRDLGQKSIDKILTRYPEVNRAWLLRGEGEMLSSNFSAGVSPNPSWDSSVKNSENTTEMFSSVLSVLKTQLETKDKQIERLLDLLRDAK